MMLDIREINVEEKETMLDIREVCQELDIKEVKRCRIKEFFVKIRRILGI